MYTTVKRAIESICLSRDEYCWQTLDEDALAALVEEFGESDLANRLYQEIPRSVPFEVVCDLFDLLAWRTEDNGTSVTCTIEHWLREGVDNRKLLIALHLDVYPFIDPAEMDEVLSQLAKNNLKVSSRCLELIEKRKESKGTGLKSTLCGRFWNERLTGMNTFRKWIKRDDGKLFRIKNEKLNFLEIIGCALLVCSFLMHALKSSGLIIIPKWAVIAVAAVALIIAIIGGYKKYDKA